jgi:outer membrane protein TolC
MVDTMIFAEQLQKLTPQELKEARKTKMYRMLARLGRQAYRAGEAGLRPRPSLMVLSNDAQEADEQVTPTEARPQVNGGVSEAEADSAGGGASVPQFPATQPPQPTDTSHSPGVL